MKKIITLILIVVCLANLVACASNAKRSTSDPTSSDSSETKMTGTVIHKQYDTVGWMGDYAHSPSFQIVRIVVVRVDQSTVVEAFCIDPDAFARLQAGYGVTVEKTALGTRNIWFVTEIHK